MSNVKPDPKAFFFEALEQGTPLELAAFLDANCGDSGELRGRVEELLRAHQKAGNFLGGSSEVGDTVDLPEISETAGTQIGPYKLLQKIGEGGMGSVFMAEQIRPVTRRVAVKIIKPRMDSKSVIARFEAERQALAMMDHPNIAKVLDAGTTDAGRPYFVMELVKGVPVTEYCDDRKLPIRDRLSLFTQVCKAVQHAHQKGIIHRDIKPSNVLVAKYDDKPVPKVIDFGVAKATSQRLTEKTMFTQYGQIVGTLEYMSPEQAQFNQLDVDTRSDIYSLGVLLYELLTGETPFDGKRLRSSAFEEILRILREEEPPKPSNRISTLGEKSMKVSGSRSVETAKLGTLLRAELDWIVMCCLEKERSRRYETAAELAADVQRYLGDEPVQVVPPSRLYKARRVVRRNRVPLAVAASYVVLSVIALVFVFQQKRVAESQADRANMAVADLQENLISQALAAAFSGDRAELESAFKKLTQLGLSTDGANGLRNLHQLFSGNTNSAIDDLRKMVQADATDVTAWSILVVAYRDFALDLDRESYTSRQLEQLEAHTDLERLLFAYALPRHPNQVLGDIVERKPNWGIAQAILAGTLCDSVDHRGEVRNLERAKHHIGRASQLLPDHPFVLSIELKFLSTQYILSSGKPLDDLAEADVDQRSRQVVALLDERFSDFAFGQRLIAEYHTARGEYGDALLRWERLVTNNNSKVGLYYYVPLALLQGSSPKISKSMLMPWYYVYCDDPEGALEAAELPIWRDSAIGKAWTPSVLQMCGRSPEEIQAAISRAKSLKNDHAYWVTNVVKLFDGEMTPKQMYDFAMNQDDRFLTTHHLMTLAHHAASKGDNREQALRYLDEALDLNCRSLDTYLWCKLLKKKLTEQADWPESLRRVPNE